MEEIMEEMEETAHKHVVNIEFIFDLIGEVTNPLKTSHFVQD